MHRASRAGLAAFLTAGFVLCSAASALAAGQWTIAISPSSAAYNVSTNFGLIARNVDENGGIRCVIVNVPGGFVVTGATVGQAGWQVQRANNEVTVSTTGGNALVPGGTLGFTITARAIGGGGAWPANAYTGLSCSGGALPASTNPVSVTGGPSTPQPTVAPTPQPTSRPTPRQTPRPDPPGGPPASVGPPPSAGPSSSTTPGGAAVASPTPTATPGEGDPAPTSTQSAGGNPSAGPVSPGEVPPEAPARGARVATGQVPFRYPTVTGETAMDAASIAFRGGDLGVPSAIIAGPGVLILIWIGLQSLGTLAWAPAVGRLRGDRRRKPLNAPR